MMTFFFSSTDAAAAPNAAFGICRKVCVCIIDSPNEPFQLEDSRFNDHITR